MRQIFLKANGEIRISIIALLMLVASTVGTAFGFGIKWSGMATKADVSEAKTEAINHADKCDTAILVEMRRMDQERREQHEKGMKESLDRYIDLLNKVHTELMRLQTTKQDKR